MVRSQKLSSILLTTTLFSTFPGNPSSGAPPLKLPTVPSRPGEGRASQLQIKQEEGSFFYFLAALVTLGGVGLGVRALATRVQRSQWVVNRELWGGALGAMLAGLVATAFMTAFGSPNGRPSGAFWMGVVFVTCSAQLGRQAAREAVRTSDPQASEDGQRAAAKSPAIAATAPRGDGPDPNAGEAHA